jgi:hypothetical protein
LHFAHKQHTNQPSPKPPPHPTQRSAADLAARYRALFDAALAAQGRSIDWARAAHADYPYVRAYDDSDVLSALRAEAAAAASNVVEEKEVWHPPPPDEQPETAHDYE